jgi:TrmH family RNA methyltransferase
MAVALEGVKDPGNLGTIIRTTDAVGASALLLIGETTDPFSLEAVRATMGSIFHVPLYRATREEFLSWHKSWPGEIVGTHLKGAVDYRTVKPKEPVLVMMGNEQSGLPDDFAESCDHLVKIPMAGRAESLNLAISTGITLFRLREGKLGL